jgi:hypothetical protein
MRKSDMPADKNVGDILPPDLGGRPLIVFDGVCVLCSGFG